MVAVTHEQSGLQECCVDRGLACAGSKCMAWRWYTHRLPRKIMATDLSAQEEPPRPERVPPSFVWRPAFSDGSPDELACWCEPEEEVDINRKGFCGVAGRPNTL